MRQPVLKGLFGLLLIVVISVPTFGPSLHHLLHAHHRHACRVDGGDTHLHKDQFSCELCDYLTSCTLYFNDEAATPQLQPGIAILPDGAKTTPAMFGVDQCYLRGPPCFAKPA